MPLRMGRLKFASARKRGLKAAAQSRNPEIKAAALQVLRKLGQ